MRGTVSLSLLASALVMNAMAADSLESMFKEGKVSGQIRAFYINRDYSNSYDRDGFAVGGKLNYETASLNGLSLGTTFYTTNRLNPKSLPDTHNDKTLFDSTGEGYTYMGQAYVNYKNGNTNIKVGRQELNTPLAGGDDARMLPNTFEAAVLSNTDVKDTTLVAAHVSKISYGSFANAYLETATTAAGQSLALESGYGAVTTNYHNGQYQSMSQAVLGNSVPNRGVSAVAVVYNGIPNLSVQVWDYYAHDILNAIYAQADYKIIANKDMTVTGSAQYIKEDNVGEKLAGNVDADYYGLQLSAKVGNTTLTAAYSSTGSSNDANNGMVISPWGGMPAFTQAMVTRHQFFADTDSYKFSGTYNLKDLTGWNTTATAYFCHFKTGDQVGSTTYDNLNTTEKGFDIINNIESVKGLQLRFRGNYQREFSALTTGGRDEYRVIANYNF